MRLVNKIKKILAISSVVFVLLIIALIINSGSTKNKYDDYTTYNTDTTGTKALYMLTEQMGFHTGRFTRPVRFIPEGCTMVVIEPSVIMYIDDLEKKYLKEWLLRGNTLILSSSNSDLSIELINGLGAQKTNDVTDYASWMHFQVGKGSIYANDLPDNYTNEGLKSSNPALSFINILDMAGNKKVLFNEYYHGIGREGTTIWDIIGPRGELLVLQFVLGFSVLMYIFSRRFGKPVTVFETVKRRENENVFALSNIYSKSKANVLVLETIMGNFKKELTKYLGLIGQPGDEELIAAAKGSKFLSDMDMEGLLNRCAYFLKSGGGNMKELVYLAQKIEKIRKGIK